MSGTNGSAVTCPRHEIIKNIFITVDRRVIVCHAPGNIEPQVFQEEEYGPLTTLLREEGYERLEEEILYLFFLGVWQNDLRHGRAVARAIEQERENGHKCRVGLDK